MQFKQVKYSSCAVSMASAEQVMTLRSDGGCAVERSRECCPDGIAEAVWDIRGNEGRNILKYCAESVADPVSSVLGSYYPRHCLIDVDNEVFEFNGRENVFNNCVKQLPAKSPGRI